MKRIYGKLTTWRRGEGFTWSIVAGRLVHESRLCRPYATRGGAKKGARWFAKRASIEIDREEVR